MHEGVAENLHCFLSLLILELGEAQLQQDRHLSVVHELLAFYAIDGLLVSVHLMV